MQKRKSKFLGYTFDIKGVRKQKTYTSKVQVKILLKYKESVPDRTKITVEFGTTGVHISYMPA